MAIGHVQKAAQGKRNCPLNLCVTSPLEPHLAHFSAAGLKDANEDVDDCEPANPP